MQRTIRWNGRDLPFEGTRTVPLRVIPEGARVLAARILLSPAPAEPPAVPFDETLSFTPGELAWGATKTPGPDFLEVDFRGRRTIAEVIGQALSQSRLQVDLGGMYMEVNQSGALRQPTDPLFTLSQAEVAATPGRFVLPSFEVTRIKLFWPPPPAVGARPAAADVAKVVVQSVPTNVSLHLADQPAFFVHQGALTQPVATADFAPVLGEFLSRAPLHNGFHDVPVVIRSQNISRIALELEIDFVEAQHPLPDGNGEAVFTYDFSGQPSTEELVVQVPPNCQVLAGATSVKLQGTFDDSRVAFGPIGSLPAKGELVLAPLRGLPQAYSVPFRLPESLKVKSVDLLVRPVGAAAELRLDIRDDLDGKPGLNSLLSSAVTFDAHPTATQAPQWVSVPFTEETRLSERPNLWLSLEVLRGEAAWALGEFAQLERSTPARHALHATSDGGLSWQASEVEARTLAAHPMFRLRHAPKRFTMPIEVRVGRGPSARRVPLERFEALGRVDFTLDTAELADAINQHVVEHPTAPPGEGEQLLNGDFQRWTQVGDLAQEPRPIILRDVGALVFAPDGRRLYAASQGRVVIVDPLAPEAPPRELVKVQAAELAIVPDGRRIYAAGGAVVVVIDTLASREVGQSRVFGVGPVAASADHLFALVSGTANTGAPSGPQLWRFARTRFDATAALGQGIDPEQTLDLDPDNVPVALAVSPDGRRVYLGGFQDVRIVDAASLADARPPIQGGASSIAPLPDGKRALIVRQGTLMLLNFETGFVEPFPAAPIAGLVDAVVPIMVFDALAVLLSANDEQLAAIIEMGARTPEAWHLTTGNIHPALLSGEAGYVGLLGEKEGPVSAVSQMTTVSPGRRYEVAFAAVADQPGAAAEVIWRGDSCARQRIESIAVAASPDRKDPPDTLVRHRLVVEAPAGATQAEIRYRTISGVRAYVGATSFRPVVNLVANASFQSSAASGEIAEGWTLIPEGAAGFSLESTPEGTLLENAGARPVTLAQTFPVGAGIPFLVEADASIVTVGATLPMLQVRWVDSLAPFVELELDPEVFGAYVARGTVPNGVVMAELRLVLPAGTSVTVTLIQVRLRPPADVPIEIVSHTPGQVRASDFTVVTEETPPTTPPAPEGGFCPPTKPGADPDDPEDCDCCPCCGDNEPPSTVEPRVMTAAQPEILVACVACGATRTRNFVTPGSAAVVARRPAVTVNARPLSRMPRAATPVAQTSTTRLGPARRAAVGLGPLLAVSILSQPARNALAASGMTLSEMAGADADTVLRLAPGLRPGTASALIRRARRLHEALEQDTGH